eukprot:g2821.t1
MDACSSTPEDDEHDEQLRPVSGSGSIRDHHERLQPGGDQSGGTTTNLEIPVNPLNGQVEVTAEMRAKVRTLLATEERERQIAVLMDAHLERAWESRRLEIGREYTVKKQTKLAEENRRLREREDILKEKRNQSQGIDQIIADNLRRIQENQEKGGGVVGGVAGSPSSRAAGLLPGAHAFAGAAAGGAPAPPGAR